VLWNGGQLPHHPSPSEADCSLAYRLLWYTDGDTQRTRNLFCQSPRALREKVRNRPDLVERAVNAAYGFYQQRKQQLQYITQTANTANWDITQQYPCAENVGTHDYSAKVCAAAMWGEIVYLPNQDGWMVYNRNTGLWDNSEAQLYQRVKSILEHHYYHLALSKTISDKELDRILARIHHGDTVKKVIERMEMMPELHKEPQMFNANEMLIPLQNGVYDLNIEPDQVDPDSLRRKFRPYRPDDYITHAFAANYNPDANGEHWTHALEQWCWDPATDAPDTELIEYLWYAIGYTVTGSADEQAMFIVYGPGGNGKSTLVSTIAKMMGNYATTMMQNLFTVDKYSAEPARQLEPLRNKRMVVHPELPTQKKLDCEKIKHIVSNDDVQTRRLYEEAKATSPTWKIWCTANDIPEITDQAAWRRIRIIPFRKVFVQNIKTLLPVGQRDPKLPQKLWAQRDYLATQACHYAALWRKKTELPHSTTVAQVTEDVHRVSDPFEDWFNNCVEIDASGVVPNNEVYEHYKQYVESVEQSPLTTKKWAQRMGQKRVPVVRTMHNGKQTRCRTGIKLIQHDN
jgi:putative DNA primase/helicase